MSKTPEEVQGQITALKEILVTIIDVLADDNPDILRLVRARHSTGPVPEFAIGPAGFHKGRQIALNDFAADLEKIFESRSRG